MLQHGVTKVSQSFQHASLHQQETGNCSRSCIGKIQFDFKVFTGRFPSTIFSTPRFTCFIVLMYRLTVKNRQCSDYDNSFIFYLFYCSSLLLLSLLVLLNISRMKDSSSKFLYEIISGHQLKRFIKLIHTILHVLEQS